MDRALVVAFIAGVATRDSDTPIGEALCAKHGELAADCLGFLHSRGFIEVPS